MGAAWRFVWCVLYYPLSATFKLRYRNIDRIPQRGGAIVVLNHVSHVDPFLVSKFILDAARTPRFLAKDAIFEVPVVGWAMRGMGHIPVRRGSADAAQSLAGAVEFLRGGGMIVLHPEGTVTRDPDGWPMAGKTGAARLATLVPEVPVIPIAQWGVQEQVDLYHKKFKLIPRPRHVISVGEPIDLSKWHGVEVTPRVLHEISDAIMKRLRADVAELRGVPAPDGELFVWKRPASPGKGAAA
jgi:1-acyl-sn-glycerol-3-phosphate acyltransferase